MTSTRRNRPPRRCGVARAGRRHHQEAVSSGTIGPRKEILWEQISGIVDELFVEAGATVSAGAVLARVRVVEPMAATHRGPEPGERSRISMENIWSARSRARRAVHGPRAVPRTTARTKSRRPTCNPRRRCSRPRHPRSHLKEGAASRAGEAQHDDARQTVHATRSMCRLRWATRSSRPIHSTKAPPSPAWRT